MTTLDAKAVLDAIQGADDPRMIGWASALQSLVAGAMGELAQATEHHERSQEITACAREPIAIAFTTICSAGLDLAQAEQGLAASAWGQVAQAIGAIEDRRVRPDAADRSRRLNAALRRRARGRHPRGHPSARATARGSASPARDISLARGTRSSHPDAGVGPQRGAIGAAVRR